MTPRTHPPRNRPRVSGERAAYLRAESERGSITVELVLVVPIFIVLMLFIVALGRASNASIEVQDAAHAAARAATLATSPGAAETAAEQAASQALAESAPPASR